MEKNRLTWLVWERRALSPRDKSVRDLVWQRKGQRPKRDSAVGWEGEEKTGGWEGGFRAGGRAALAKKS